MKKIFTTLLLIFSLSLCKAQWVTIPDAVFVTYLQTYFASAMNGNQMDTTSSVVVNATSFSWPSNPYPNVSNLSGLEYFNSLTTIDCSENLLTWLPQFPLTLKYLHCENNLLTSLPSLPNSMIELWCNDNQLSFLPMLPNSITRIDCYNNQLTSITLPSSIQFLDCNNNQITFLPSIPPSLTRLHCAYNQLNYLPVLPNNLLWLYCNNNQLTSLPLLPITITNLYCGGNQLTSLPPLPAILTKFYCNDNLLIDLPALPSSLTYFGAYNNPSLHCLPALQYYAGVNGNFNISNTGITCLPNVIQHTGFIPAIDTMPICDVFNQYSCPVAWNIKGVIFLDADSSCTTTNDGTPLQMLKVKLYNSGGILQQQVIANWGGDYSFNTSLGIFSTSIDTTNIPFNVLCPSANSISSNLTAIDSLDYNINFRLVCKSGFDVGVWNAYRTHRFFPNDITPVHVLAGDFAQYISYGSCTSGIAGEIKIIIDSPALYVSPIAGALIPSVSGDTLIYVIADFSILNPAADFAFNLLCDTTAQIGDLGCFTVIVTPTTGDNNISNNIFTRCIPVSNSFDPNEKEVSPVGALPNQFQDWLTYTIHFQNTGTAAAQHIQILDTLDADLDASTFQLLSYSHAPMVQLFGSNVKFNFPNINLPDSTTDFEGSKGYLSYRVKPLANLPLGTTIENTASIYFDFNTPVVTNTVSNLICNPIVPTNLSQTICAGDSYNFNGNNLSTAGNYSVTLNAINGCDSVVNLNLTVIIPDDTLLSQQICEGETVSFNGMNLNTTGIYADTLSNIAGCDSIVTVNLNVLAVNLAVTQAGTTLSSNAAWATYQWLNCDDGFAPLIGDTNAIFVATANGNYAVAVTQMGCTDTSACYSVTGIGIDELAVGNLQFAVYPNPAESQLTVSSRQLAGATISITDILGRELLSEFLSQPIQILNLESLSSGIYFVTVISANGNSAVKKFVKE